MNGHRPMMRTDAGFVRFPVTGFLPGNFQAPKRFTEKPKTSPIDQWESFPVPLDLHRMSRFYPSTFRNH